MKTEVHPEYKVAKVHCSCGNEFETRSTKDSLRVELCNVCHPFFTGKQRLVDTGGRVERFQRRWGDRKRRQPETSRRPRSSGRGSSPPSSRHSSNRPPVPGIGGRSRSRAA